MGNIIGLSTTTNDNQIHLLQEIVYYDNLNIKDVELLWYSFYEYANGFIINNDELFQILYKLGEKYGEIPNIIKKRSDELFDKFKTEKDNEYVNY